jgi:CheY-like chemotaxis protein
MYSALIIEDDKELGEIFADILFMDGWQAELVQDGPSALKILETRIPDVIMLDMHLPMMSGPEILHCIRSDERWKKIKVMVVTADAFVGKFMEEEADMVLIKPVTMDQLTGLTKRLIEIEQRT